MKNSWLKICVILLLDILGILIICSFTGNNEKKHDIPIDCVELRSKKIHSIVEYTFYASKGFYVIITNNGKDYILSSCYQPKHNVPGFESIVKGDIITKEAGTLNINVCTLDGDTFIVEGQYFNTKNN